MTKVPIKGIKVYWSGGKRYAYHRPTKTPLKAPYGTPQFFAELAEIERKYRERRGQAATAKPGTWGALVVQYKEHRLPQLARRTQADYHKFLDWLSPLDGMPLSDWSRGFAIKLRDKAFKQHGRRFANYVISVVQAVFSWGLERDYVTKHPVQNVKAIEAGAAVQEARRRFSAGRGRVLSHKMPANSQTRRSPLPPNDARWPHHRLRSGRAINTDGYRSQDPASALQNGAQSRHSGRADRLDARSMRGAGVTAYADQKRRTARGQFRSALRHGRD